MSTAVPGSHAEIAPPRNQPAAASTVRRIRPDEGFLLDPARGRLLAIPYERGLYSLVVERLSAFHVIATAVDARGLAVGHALRFSLGRPPDHPLVRDLEGVVVRTRERKGAIEVEIDFASAAFHRRREVGRLIARLLEAGALESPFVGAPEPEIITDAAHIAEILYALTANGANGFVRSDAPGARVRLAAAGRIESGNARCIQWWVERPWPAPPFGFTIRSYNSVYEFCVESCEDVDGLLAFFPPRRLARTRVRASRRIAAAGLTVSFRHPDCKDLRVARRVIDVSHRGLSFATSLAEDMLHPGLELPALVVSAGDKCSLLEGRVCHVSMGAHGEEPICGIEIVPRSPFHPRLGWAHILEPHLHPTTTRSGADETAALWELLHAAGYFHLSGKNRDDFDPMWERFRHVSRKYAQHPALGCQVLWRSPHGIDATISIALMYSGTWLLYQLARRKGRTPTAVRGRQVVRDVYVHAFEHAAWYPSLRWVLAYTEANVRWHRDTHHDFAARYAHTGKVMNIPFHLMEDSTRTPRVAPGGFEIGDATTEELEQFIAAVRESYPAGFADAIDLVPSRFYLEDVNRALAPAGLKRDRRLFVARRDGVPIAAALCETGTEGTHLFRLFDGVRLVALRPDSDSAALDLIAHVRGWYLEQGRDAFVYYMLPDQRELGRVAGMRDLGAGHAWLIHASLIDDFLEHVDRMAAPPISTHDERIPGGRSSLEEAK